MHKVEEVYIKEKMHDIVIDEYMNDKSNKSLWDVSISICATGNAKWIYFFILRILNRSINNISSIDLSTLEGKKNLYTNIKDILDIDITYLKKIIISISDAEYIYKFQKNIIGLIKKIEKLINKNYEEIVCAMDELGEASTFNKFWTLISELEKLDFTNEILKTKSLKYICKYYSSIKGANKNKIISEVLKSRNAKYVYMIAKAYKGSDIYKFAEKLIEIGNAKYIYLFAKNIEIDPSMLEEAIIESNSPKYIYLFARDIKGANIKVLLSALLDTGNIEYICEFAKNIKDNFERIEIDAIVSGNPKYIYEIAKIKKYDTKELEFAIKQTKNPKYMYLFARDIKGVSITSMETCIVRCNNPEYMYLFAKNIRGADIYYIGRMIFKTKNMNWIYKFFMDIPNADIEFALEEIKKYDLDPDNKYIPHLMNKLSKMEVQDKTQEKENQKMNKYIDKMLIWNNPKEIYEAARKYKIRLAELTEAMLKTDNPRYIYRLACIIEAKNKSRFVDRIIELKSPKYMYLSAMYIKGANKLKIARELIKTGSIEYIILFYQNIKDIDILKILDSNCKFYFEDTNTLLATPYDLYKILLSAAFDKKLDIKSLSDYLKLPEYKLDKIIKYIKIKYRVIANNNSEVSMCQENIPQLGRMYDDVCYIINEFRNIDTEDNYISNLVEKYYLEDNQEFLDNEKVKIKKI